MLLRQTRLVALASIFSAMLFLGSAVASAASSKVMLLSFRAAGEPDHYAWVSDAIHESMLSDLQRNAEVQIIAAPAVAVDATPGAALAAARQANADLVIFGSFQVVGDQLRVNAQALDVASGQSKASPAVTGPVRSLFIIEDQLAEEMHKALPGVAAAPAPIPAPTFTDNQQPAQSQPPMVFAPLDAQGSLGSGYATADTSAQATAATPQYVVPTPGYSYLPIYNPPPAVYYENGYQPPVYYYPPDAYAYPPDYVYPDYLGGYLFYGGSIGFGDRGFRDRGAYDRGRDGGRGGDRNLGAAPRLPARASLGNGVTALPHR